MTLEKHKILLFASEKFFRDGFRKVSMDELAKEMKISKKTIYRHFASKEEIVEATVDSLQTNLKRAIDQIINN
ncbi:MAG: helix-turn-helix transcriptional regulator, partial [Melioribacteraceae bacterium]|nr:helix-turn-helix transcriptional regulator [Melioribacteraceae bacterium]